MISEVYNGDCMDYMARFPDKFFELAVVDPPYGININHSIGRRKGQKASGFKKCVWDSEIPNREYFNELIRVSKNQIIWGGNYFTEYLKPSPCWILWDKGFSEDLTFAQFEMAYTSFKSSAKKFDKCALQPIKIHPTQKPISLYKWILKNYAKDDDKILDTHLGSGSSRIAAHQMGFDFYGCELDKEYFDASVKRFENEIKQQSLFEFKQQILI